MEAISPLSSPTSVARRRTASPSLSRTERQVIDRISHSLDDDIGWQALEVQALSHMGQTWDPAVEDTSQETGQGEDTRDTPMDQTSEETGQGEETPPIPRVIVVSSPEGRRDREKATISDDAQAADDDHLSHIETDL